MRGKAKRREARYRVGEVPKGTATEHSKRTPRDLQAPAQRRLQPVNKAGPSAPLTQTGPGREARPARTPGWLLMPLPSPSTRGPSPAPLTPYPHAHLDFPDRFSHAASSDAGAGDGDRHRAPLSSEAWPRLWLGSTVMNSGEQVRLIGNRYGPIGWRKPGEGPPHTCTAPAPGAGGAGGFLLPAPLLPCSRPKFPHRAAEQSPSGLMLKSLWVREETGHGSSRSSASLPALQATRAAPEEDSKGTDAPHTALFTEAKPGREPAGGPRK